MGARSHLLSCKPQLHCCVAEWETLPHAGTRVLKGRSFVPPNSSGALHQHAVEKITHSPRAYCQETWTLNDE